MDAPTHTFHGAGVWVARKSGRHAVGLAAALGVVVTLGLAGPAVAAGPLTLTSRSPSSGPVGTLVTLTGTGLASRDVVMFNGRSTAPVSVNAAGTSLTARVPAFATSGVVSVEDPATGQVASLPNSPFRVTTGVFASPNHVWAGGTLTFSGSALTPDQTDAVYISRTRVGSVTTDRFGDFQVGVSVPWDIQSGKLFIEVIDPRLGDIVSILWILGAWPEFRHDSGHLGVDTFETALTRSSVPKLAIKWQSTTGAAVTSGPVVANGIMYVDTLAGSLLAFDAGTGHFLWSFSAGGEIDSTPAVDNNRVFVYSTNGVFYALNATTGKLLWQRSIGADSDSSPVTANGMVFVGTYHDGTLYAFNQATGAMAWDFPTNGALDSPAVANGVVYVGSEDGHVYAVNASTGVQDWKRDIGAVEESSPAVAGGQVYVGTKSGTLYSLDASTGAVTWSWSSSSASPPDGSPMVTSPAVDGGLVFIAGFDGRLYAIDAATGTHEWGKKLGPDLVSSPAVANGVIYIGGGLGDDLVALNTDTGSVIWSDNLGSAIDSSPAVSNGFVYVGSMDAHVYAFGL